MRIKFSWKQFDRIIEFLRRAFAPAGNDLPPKPGASLPLPQSQSEIFLNKSLGLWMHTALSPLVNDDVFNAMISTKKQHNTNVWWMYMFNERDYGGLVVSFYADKFAGTVDAGRVAWMRARMARAIREGFAIVAWLTADDSPSVNRSTAAQKVAHAENVHRLFNDLISGYVIGLELEETTPVTHAEAVATRLRSLTPKSIGVHEVIGKTTYAAIPAVDTMYFQNGFGKNAATVAAEIKRAIAQVGGKKVIAAEYHLDSTSAEAKALGQAALAAGAVGTGNGR